MKKQTSKIQQNMNHQLLTVELKDQFKRNIVSDLFKQRAQIGVVGLGYVGLPIALAFAEQCQVVGFDINSKKIQSMQNQIDPSHELTSEDFLDKNISFTDNQRDLARCRFYIVAVPTPIDEDNNPNLTPLTQATQAVANVLKPGDYVVFESTVYPGCTEEVCLPILEGISGLKVNRDFKLGYSPERINPGDKNNTIKNIVKVVSGSDKMALNHIAQVYASIIDAGVHKASSIKVAESSKIIENTQRDVNIALMNEFSSIFRKLNIDTNEVLKATATKWNALNFYPGLVGGHCIGVDPYYLIHKAKKVGYTPRVMLSSRMINDNLPKELAQNIAQKVYEAGKNPKESTILVLGATFKENVSDVRNSKAAVMCIELKKTFKEVDVMDVHADKEAVKAMYGFDLTDQRKGVYDAVVLAVNHKEYESFTEKDLINMGSESTIIYDLKSTFKGKTGNLPYFNI